MGFLNLLPKVNTTNDSYLFHLITISKQREDLEILNIFGGNHFVTSDPRPQTREMAEFSLHCLRCHDYVSSDPDQNKSLNHNSTSRQTLFVVLFFWSKKKQEINGGELVLFQLKSKSPRRKLCHSMEEIYTFKGIVVQKVVGLKSPYHWEIIHFANCYTNTKFHQTFTPTSAVAVYVWCPVYILSGFFSSTYTSNPKQLSIHIIGIFDLPFKFHKIPRQFSYKKWLCPIFVSPNKNSFCSRAACSMSGTLCTLDPSWGRAGDSKVCWQFPQDLMAKGRFKSNKTHLGMFLVAQNWLGISILPWSFSPLTFQLWRSKSWKPGWSGGSCFTLNIVGPTALNIQAQDDEKFLKLSFNRS